ADSDYGSERVHEVVPGRDVWAGHGDAGCEGRGRGAGAGERDGICAGGKRVDLGCGPREGNGAAAEGGDGDGERCDERFRDSGGAARRAWVERMGTHAWKSGIAGDGECEVHGL